VIAMIGLALCTETKPRVLVQIDNDLPVPFSLVSRLTDFSPVVIANGQYGGNRLSQFFHRETGF
jgi:hypothetical protein